MVSVFSNTKTEPACLISKLKFNNDNNVDNIQFQRLGWLLPQRGKCRSNSTMGPTETKKFSFSHFFPFFVFSQKMEDEKWKMDFLHFLPIFGLMLDIFDEFLKFSSILHMKNDKRWRKSLYRNFSQPTNENIC